MAPRVAICARRRSDAGVVAQDVDIADDGSLLERYGARIPVLRRTDNGAELGWPFDAVAVVQFLV